ncbi:unnamed protein product, partial [Durusdinium trenchii]
VAALLDKHLVVRLLSLVRMCGPFNCGAGIKFLQLMGTVLQSRSSNPDVDMLVTCHILLSYASSIVDDAVSALQGDQEQQRLGCGFRADRETGKKEADMGTHAQTFGTLWG